MKKALMQIDSLPRIEICIRETKYDEYKLDVTIQYKDLLRWLVANYVSQIIIQGEKIWYNKLVSALEGKFSKNTIKQKSLESKSFFRKKAILQSVVSLIMNQ